MAATVESYRAHLGVEAALCPIILALALLASVTIRRSKQPASRGIKRLYASFALLFLANLFEAIEWGLFLQTRKSLVNAKQTILLTEPRQRIDIFTYLFRTAGACAILVSITGLASGIYHSDTGSGRKRPYYLILEAGALVCGILALAVFSGQQWVLSQLVKSATDPKAYYAHHNVYDVQDTARHFSMLSGVIDILLLVLAVAITIWVLVVDTKIRRATSGLKSLYTSLDLLLAASLLNLVPRGFRMVQVAWIPWKSGGRGTSVANNGWWSTADLVLDHVVTVLVLGLLYGAVSWKAKNSGKESKDDAEGSMEQTNTARLY